MRDSIVAEARTWLNTPFQHQAHAKGLGVDCGGLVASVGVAVGAFPEESWAMMFAEHVGYSRTPANGALEAICYQFMKPIPTDSAREGDVVLIRFQDEPQHVAILAPYVYGGLSIIHAYSRAAPGRVVEHRMADVWRARVAEAFAYPGVN